jgi:hypothetical protein
VGFITPRSRVRPPPPLPDLVLQYRHAFAKLIWQIASPQWDLDDVTFNRSATSLDNPDQVDIVIHNYRWRLSLAVGDRQYDELEKPLAAGPVITLPPLPLMPMVHHTLMLALMPGNSRADIRTE